MKERLHRFKLALLCSTSHRALAPQLVKLHDASLQTVILRSGLRLGLISPVNFGSKA
jgi:hypothetical protein